MASSSRTRIRLPHPAVSVPALLVYGFAVFFSNWLTRHVGPIVIPGGTHLLPVGFGLAAVSGTYAAGVTFVARDLVQRTAGRGWSLVIIVPGIALTAAMDVRLALASGAAFAFSELADYLVYTPLQRRHFVGAVFASGIAASVIDSLLFLSIAGIPLAVALAGQLVGKAEVQLLFLPLAVYLRRRLPYARPFPRGAHDDLVMAHAAANAAARRRD